LLEEEMSAPTTYRILLRWIQSATLLGVGLFGLVGFSHPSPAVQLADGTVYFERVPRLLGAATSNADTHWFGARYYFSLAIPAEAGEPLKSVKIKQSEGLDDIEFNLARTQAWRNDLRSIGDHRRRGTPIALDPTQIDAEGNIIVTFSEAVLPGQSLVVALQSYWNPDIDGVYLFGVSVSPDGPKAYSQFIGYGRLHFYRRSHFLFP
jgi:hypothetical protein